MTVGRVWANGVDKGSGFALATPHSRATRVVLTANHVIRDKEASSLQFVTQAGRRILVESIERDEDLDVAVLHLSEDVAEGPGVGHAIEGATWQVETQPLGNDPKLTGNITDTHRYFIKGQGQPAMYVVQLQVDQNLDDYKGYSGSPVALKSPSGAVIGILVEQLLSRLSVPIGQPKPATNVLYAISIQEVLNQFGLTATQTVDEREKTFPAYPKSFIPHPPSLLFQPRPGEFKQLEDLLFESRREKLPPRVGLVGMGGVGKTQLAVELAYRCMDQHRYPGGVFWMSATGTNVFDWQRQLAALAVDTDYLPSDDNLSSSENERRRARHLCRYLAEHQDALLILDNVEDPNLVRTALPALAGGKVACSVLYTSRITLQPEEVALYHVEQLLEGSALRLLLQETRQTLLAQIEAEQSDTETQCARAICQSVGYLPLALMHLRGLLKRDQHLTLARVQQELTKHGALNLVQALFSTFELSWEQVRGEEAQHMFKLACYFPEAARIQLWLLGLAAGLGEEGDILTSLGKARLQLQELSLLEVGSDEEVSLHPLVREFGQILATSQPEQAKTLRSAALHRLVAFCNDLHALELRARHAGFWVFLEQIRTLQTYAGYLNKQPPEIERIERWLDRESYLLGNEQWWPEVLPGLFYQQIFNRAVEAGQVLEKENIPALWVRQTKPVRAEDQALLRIFRGHTSWVMSVAFSPDGRQVLTGSYDDTARLWEASSGRELRRFGHPNGVSSVTFSPDGRRILTGPSVEGTARLWDVNNGRELAQLQGHKWGVESVAISPDAEQVLTSTEDRIARLWETNSGRELVRLQGHTRKVNSVAFSPDGRQVLTGSDDGTARLWEVQGGYALDRLLDHDEKVSRVEFSHDGQQMLIVSNDGTARVWEVNSGRELMRLKGQSFSVTFSIDSRQIFLRSYGRIARVSKAGSRREMIGLKSHNFPVTFSPDGRQLLAGSNDGAARLWEVSSGRELARLRGHTENVTTVTFSPDGQRILTASNDHTVRVWEVSCGRELTQLEGHIHGVYQVAFSPDNQLILTGSSSDVTARLWEASSGRQLALLEGLADGVTSVAFSPDGSLVVTSDRHGRTLVWQLLQPEGCKLSALYIAYSEVQAIHWEDPTHLILADSGEQRDLPYLYYLTLEGKR